MHSWAQQLEAIDALEDLALEGDLIRRFERAHANTASDSPLHFYTPSFKAYANPELPSCGKQRWPAISITGGDCALDCDHCHAKILEPMIPARSPAALWEITCQHIEAGAQGMLLSGGSNHRNEVEYAPYLATVRRIKDSFPGFKIAIHTALVDHDMARRMEDAGIDAAMMDVIGAQDTITQVYHLKRSVDDFERGLAHLVATHMHIVPHIVLGLHYGHLLGEWRALEIVQRHRPQALVLVVVMPIYAKAHRPYTTPNAHAIGRFFLDARLALPDLPILLGCARPPGKTKMQIDAYAVMAGLHGIAHPSEGMVALAQGLGRAVRVSTSCCSLALGDEILGEAQAASAPLNTQNAFTKLSRAPSLGDIAVVVR